MAAVNATDAAPASVPPAPRGVKLVVSALLLLSAALALWSARANPRRALELLDRFEAAGRERRGQR